MKWLLGRAWPQYVNTKTNKQNSCGLGPTAEVMSEVMPEVMSAETALIKGEQGSQSKLDLCAYWENTSHFYKMRFVP